MKRLLLSLLCIPALLLTFCNDKVNSKEETESPASSAPDQLEKEGFEPTNLTAYISATLLSKFQIGNETVTIFNR